MSNRQKKFRFKRLQRQFAQRLQKLTVEAKRNNTERPIVRKGNHFVQNKKAGH